MRNSYTIIRYLQMCCKGSKNTKTAHNIAEAIGYPSEVAVRKDIRQLRLSNDPYTPLIMANSKGFYIPGREDKEKSRLEVENLEKRFKKIAMLLKPMRFSWERQYGEELGI